MPSPPATATRDTMRLSAQVPLTLPTTRHCQTSHQLSGTLTPLYFRVPVRTPTAFGHALQSSPTPRLEVRAGTTDCRLTEKSNNAEPFPCQLETTEKTVYIKGAPRGTKTMPCEASTRQKWRHRPIFVQSPRQRKPTPT